MYHMAMQVAEAYMAVVIRGVIVSVFAAIINSQTRSNTAFIYYAQKEKSIDGRDEQE